MPTFAILVVTTKFLDVVLVLTFVRGVAGVDGMTRNGRSAILAGDAFALESDQLGHGPELTLNRFRGCRRRPGDEILFRRGFLA